MKKQIPIPHNLIGVKLILSVCFFLVTILIIGSTISRKEPNDNILELDSNNILFRNENPDFKVDFVSDEEQSYIRFETKGSNYNPFEERKLTVGESIEESLGIAGLRKGIKLSLKGVSYDETMREKVSQAGLALPSGEQEKGTYEFELTEVGRSIGSEEEETVSKKTVISKDIVEGIDIEYQIISGKGLKEEIVLNELPMYSEDCKKEICKLPANEFYFDLELDKGLKLNRNVTEGTYFFTDSNGTYYAHFLPEYAKDALGNKTNEVEVRIEETVNENMYVIVVTLDSEWLLSSERVFPVRIDPSIVHDTNNVFNTGSYDGTQTEEIFSRIGLKDSFNGDYTSPVFDIGENSRLRSVSLKAYGSDTAEGEIPFSTTGMLTQWSFNEENGITVSNLSNCNDECELTLSGFVDTTSKDKLSDSGWSNIYSKWGRGALLFDGKDDLVSGSVPDISNKEIYSIEIWVLPTGNDGYVFTSNLGSLIIDEGNWKVISGDEIFDSEIEVEYYKWQHLVVIFDNSKPGVKVFVDSQNIESEDYTLQAVNSNTVYIGGYPSKPYFKGVIDVTRIYERALTETEIYSNAQSGYIGMQYRESSDGIDWNKWNNSFEKNIEIGEVKADSSQSVESTPGVLRMPSDASVLPIPIVSADTSNSRLLSFLIAGDEKDGSLNMTYEKEKEGCGLNNDGPIKYIGVWMTPNKNTQSCVLSNTTENKYTLSFKDNRVLLFNINDNSTELDLNYILDNPNLIALSLNENILKVYVNGFLSNVIEVESSFVLSSNLFEVSGCSIGEDLITDVELSNTPKSASEIRSTYESKLNSQNISIRFRAKLQSSDLVSDSTDREFSITETPYGAENTVENINIGDTIILKELVGDNEYMAQGVVKEINKVTGKILVTEWESESTFPPEGFTTNSKVLKWQKVYVEAGRNLTALRGDLGGLYFTRDTESEVEYMFKDFQLITPFEVGQDWNFESISSRYLQYRVILLTIDEGISPYITEVDLNYDTLGPSMEKVMRHGKWFDSGEKQSYWWAN